MRRKGYKWKKGSEINHEAFMKYMTEQTSSRVKSESDRTVSDLISEQQTDTGQISFGAMEAD